MVRAITVLATFRSSRNSCIGLLVNNIRINYYAIDFRRRYERNQTSDTRTRIWCLVSFVSFWVLGGCAWTHTPQALKKIRKKPYKPVSPMIVAASCGTKNNNASLQSNNYGQLNHTDGKSYCSVSYLEERLIADSSCIDVLGKNMRIKYLDRDFRHSARVCVCVRVRIRTRTHTHAQLSARVCLPVKELVCV